MALGNPAAGTRIGGGDGSVNNLRGRERMKRDPAGLGRVEGIYDGIRRMGQVSRVREGYFAQDNQGKHLGTYPTHAEATKAVLDADRAGRGWAGAAIKRGGESSAPST